MYHETLAMSEQFSTDLDRGLTMKIVSDIFVSLCGVLIVGLLAFIIGCGVAMMFFPNLPFFN